MLSELAVPRLQHMDSVRTSADQRSSLVKTIRDTAEWRKRKVEEFDDDPIARKRSLRAKQALGALANFVEGMPDDDPDLSLHALRRAEERDGRLLLSLDSFTLISRFGMDRGAWQASRPTESQMRNVLRRIDGIEARERHARKLRAESGYGDD
jgi:hypothetical protein